MKHGYLIGILLLASLVGAVDLDLVRIDVVDKADIMLLDRMGVIINQVHPDHIVAEISKDMYSSIGILGLRVELLQENITEVYRRNSMDISETSRSQYLTYNQYVDSMVTMAANYPEICRLDTLGYSHQNRPLLIMKISDNVALDEPEPAVHFEGNIHGDEKISWAVNFWMVRYLLENYATDTLVQRLVDTREIWIAPLVNPDGFVANSRYNSRSVDLNRNWGWMWGNASACGTDFFSEDESRRFLEHYWRHPLTIYASYHAGTLCLSEPWSYTSYLQPPEQSLIRHLSIGYAVPTGYPYGQGSIVMYPINGCTKDYDYGVGGTMSWSIEVCNQKTPPSDSIDVVWGRDRPAMLWFMHKAGQGISGIVYDSLRAGQDRLRALIYVNPANWHSYSDRNTGYFHRFYLPGTYDVTVFCPGYEPKTVSGVVVPAGTPDSSVYLEIGLIPNPELPFYATDLIATRYVSMSSNLTYPVRALGPHDNQAYKLDAAKWIVLGFDVPICDYPGNDLTVYRSTGSGTATVKVSNDCYGSWQTLGTANAAVTEFDLATSGLESARYVRIEAATQFMLDAVEANPAPTGVIAGPGSAGVERARIDVAPTVLRRGGLVPLTSSFTVPAEVRFYNLLGQEVQKAVVSPGRNGVATPNLPQGVYFLLVSGIESAQRIVLID